MDDLGISCGFPVGLAVGDLRISCRFPVQNEVDVLGPRSTSGEISILEVLLEIVCASWF